MIKSRHIAACLAASLAGITGCYPEPVTQEAEPRITPLALNESKPYRNDAIIVLGRLCSQYSDLLEGPTTAQEPVRPNPWFIDNVVSVNSSSPAHSQKSVLNDISEETKNELNIICRITPLKPDEESQA